MSSGFSWVNLFLFISKSINHALFNKQLQQVIVLKELVLFLNWLMQISYKRRQVVELLVIVLTYKIQYGFLLLIFLLLQ